MTGIDYYLCDICGNKCFYDARLDYEGGSIGVDGKELPAGSVGDIKAICQKCLVKHEIVIFERGTTGNKLNTIINSLKEEIEALKEYNKMLGDELGEVVHFLAVHGWKSKRIEQGISLRAKLDKIRTARREANK